MGDNISHRLGWISDPIFDFLENMPRAGGGGHTRIMVALEIFRGDAAAIDVSLLCLHSSHNRLWYFFQLLEGGVLCYIWLCHICICGNKSPCSDGKGKAGYGWSGSERRGSERRSSETRQEYQPALRSWHQQIRAINMYQVPGTYYIPGVNNWRFALFHLPGLPGSLGFPFPVSTGVFSHLLYR